MCESAPCVCLCVCACVCGCVHYRYNETERHLKELRGAHVALTQMVESLKKTYDTLRLKQER